MQSYFVVYVNLHVTVIKPLNPQFQNYRHEAPYKCDVILLKYPQLTYPSICCVQTQGILTLQILGVQKQCTFNTNVLLKFCSYRLISSRIQILLITLIGVILRHNINFQGTQGMVIFMVIDIYLNIVNKPCMPFIQ